MDNRPEIYLDWNATTPPLPSVLDAMREAAELGWANPSSVHAAGRRARSLIERARERLAALLAADPRDVIFTSGGTEANNLALRAAPAIVTSRIEHPSVTRVAEALEREGRSVRWLPVAPSGRIDPESVEQALGGMPPSTVVAVMAANHETGVIQPIEEIALGVHRAGARLHVDAVQALGKLEPHAYRSADSVAVGAHKIRGPKGIGALVCQPGYVPHPVLLGGAQERGLRPGTLDAVAAAGFDAALAWAESAPSHYAKLAPLRDAIEASVADSAAINGDPDGRLPHVSNLSVTGWRGDELVAALDLVGVRIASGSACSAGTTSPSSVITAMLGVERARSAIRLSLGDATSFTEVERAISLIKRIVAEHSAHVSRDA